ncbi:MAG: iron ABC transporter permease [Betaproteobacteria bacterium]|nr:MAG: iron ABC transporter permease [Betaproteobacteria bacterium]
MIDRRAALVAMALAAALVVAMIGSLAFGAYPISLSALFGGSLDATSKNVLIELRAPRVITACVAGAAFALAGAAMQSLFRNPLADPGLLGVPSAAGLGAATVVVVLASAGALAVWPAAMLGAFVAVMLLIAFAQRGGAQATASLLLLGVAINAACGAALALITSIATESQLRTLAFWMLGSFANLSWSVIAGMSVCVVIASIFLARDANALGALALGERTARSLGVDIKRLRIRVAIACAVLVAVVTAFCGNVAFVGLAAPHLARMWVGSGQRIVMLVSALIGALLCVLADIIARAVAAPVELPVGAITSILGVPMLVWLVLKMSRAQSLSGRSL